ncbi:MAG: lytic murein transglycosylase B [Gammaproteobacteria bacterium]|nr:lytic murein transglycosylase B [Gammaproteobacteria bacterium]
MKFIKKITLIALSVLITGNVSAESSYWETAAVKTFVDEMVMKHQFDKAELIGWFSGASKRQSIIDAMTRPAEAKPWKQYRPIFLTDKRITQGVNFWQRNKKLLQEAEEKYGVPAQIIVAIIGVETYYGRQIGRYPVLDALATLGFDYPPRAKFFKKELEEFLLLVRDEKLNLKETKGSYAGAMGMGQFISSSYRQYAVDFDGDGQRNLWQTTDAIGSVANYFKRHGWAKGEPVIVRAENRGISHEKEGRMMRPHRSVKSFRQQGLIFEPNLTSKGDEAVLVKLDGKDGIEYWIGLHNFYVISRYNHSPKYSMAVFQLSEEIKKRMPGSSK